MAQQNKINGLHLWRVGMLPNLHGALLITTRGRDARAAVKKATQFVRKTYRVRASVDSLTYRGTLDA